jgi:hypothetical protein
MEETEMILVRGVFHAKYGKGDELVQLLKEGNSMWPSSSIARIMTDLSGPFFTVISEAEYDSFNAWEAEAQVVFSDSRFAAWFERMVPLVESGSREFYNLVN